MPDYTLLAYLHLATVLPAFLIATALLLSSHKGSLSHRRWGRVFMVLMLLTALLSLAMPAQVGPALFGHLGGVHVLSLLVLYSVPQAWQAARQGRVAAHRAIMRRLYAGGLLLAGSLALLPGRMLHGWLFG